MQFHFGVKSVASLGVYKGKAGREVCSLNFQEARITREGGDSSRAQLFLCQDIFKTSKAILQNLHCRLLEPRVQLV